MKAFHNMGFLKKLLLVIFMTILVFFFGIVVSTQLSTQQAIRDNAIQTNQERLHTKASFLELYLEQIHRLSRNIYSNADVYSLLHDKTLSSKNSYRIYLFLRSLMAMPEQSEIFQIYLDLYSSQQSFLIGSTGFSYGPSRYHVGIPKDLPPGAVYGEGVRLSSTYGYSLGGAGTLVYSFHWNIYDSAKRTVLGTISFDLPVESLKNLAFSQMSGESIYYMLHDNGELIFASQAPLGSQDMSSILAATRPLGWAEVKSSAYSGIAFSCLVNLDNLDLYLLEVLPEDSLYSDANSLFLRNALIIFVIFLLCCGCVILVVGQLTQPLQRLDGYIRAVEKHGLNEQVCNYVTYSADDEIGRLVTHMQKMMDTIQENFNRQEKLSEAQRAAEAKMLQAQINPHFLYNALQGIASLALQHGDRETFDYITILASRMHYSMDLAHTTAPLKDEFTYVENYLNLQNMRFGQAVRTSIFLSPEAEEIVVPKMILQPLAENSFKHGQLCQQPSAHFLLTAQRRDSVLEIVCEDNGFGCEAEKLAQLNLHLAHPDGYVMSPEDGIGLLNVACRLRLFFRTQTQMYLEAPEDGGLRVTLLIPLTGEQGQIL